MGCVLKVNNLLYKNRVAFS